MKVMDMCQMELVNLALRSVNLRAEVQLVHLWVLVTKRPVIAAFLQTPANHQHTTVIQQPHQNFTQCTHVHRRASFNNCQSNHRTHRWASVSILLSMPMPQQALLTSPRVPIIDPQIRIGKQRVLTNQGQVVYMRVWRQSFQIFSHI